MRRRRTSWRNWRRRWARACGGDGLGVNLRWTHPLYRGLTGHMFGASSRRTVQDADAVVICGTYVFPDVFPVLENPFRADAKVIHIDLDAVRDRQEPSGNARAC